MPIAFRPNNQTILVIERKTQLFIGTPYTWGLANYIRRTSIMVVTKSHPNMRMLILSVDKYGYKRDIENDFS
jgi:hypothetical protein